DRDDNDFFIMFNAGEKQTPFKICKAMEGKKWVRAVDTGLPTPEDICAPGNERALPYPDIYLVRAKSLAVLISKNK
ncbi:MAG: glycogen debranching enzyme, partial [Treponema sp.]|nr:glycogen debranching enzyme [Treponema sp.]